MPWPCRTHAKEDGAAELQIWPVEVYGKPRSWSADDGVWREPIAELVVRMRAVIACEVRVTWCGGEFVAQPSRVRSLADQRGFIGWARGEREPKRLPTLDGGKVTMGGEDLRVMPQGERAWL